MSENRNFSQLNRRGFLKATPWSVLSASVLPRCRGGQLIDRSALIHRHNPVIHEVDPNNPLSVGNGGFAFTVDITGLQTLSALYDTGIPLCTMSEWGWHTSPESRSCSLDDTMEYFDLPGGRAVPYPVKSATDSAQWLRANPHRLSLGQIGFVWLVDERPQAIVPGHIQTPKQTLDLWSGCIHSTFFLDGTEINVETCCHPDYDQIGVRISSALLRSGRLGVSIAFPYGSSNWGPLSADWEHPDRHSTTITHRQPDGLRLDRVVGEDRYFAQLCWTGDARVQQYRQHEFLLTAENCETVTLACHFAPNQGSISPPHGDECFSASRDSWEQFWQNGGAVEVSGSRDSRAWELERRIILSQYLTRIQCAGLLPPQESGLTCNSWYGKFHLEMHWWHTVHFALWDRLHLMEKSLDWYLSILPDALHYAKYQGYQGARWPKMTDPSGRQSPGLSNVMTIWQQPHPIYFAELCYRQNQDQLTLERYSDIVFQTAEFLCSFLRWDDTGQRFILGPLIVAMQETLREHNINPTFDLAYWVYGLELAQQWRTRLGLQREVTWDRALQHVSALPVSNGLYMTAESRMTTDGTINPANNHPAQLGALGFLPGSGIDRDAMRRTLRKVIETWNWNSTWGWDYPFMAMTAARLQEPELAVEALLMQSPKNVYLANGHCFQDRRLPVYLPANGGVLAAVAMMAAGWDGVADDHAPGFPDNGEWSVQWEHLRRMM